MATALRFFLSVLVLFGGLSLHMPKTWAQEDAGSDVSAEADDKRFMSVYEKVKAFTQGFDSASKTHFAIISDAHNIVQVVSMVEEQVGDAVQKCGAANPSMKLLLDTRYQSWRGGIDPILEEAQANYQNMIAAQDYAKPQQIRDVLSFIDRKRIYNRGEVEPVTTPEACEYLRSKMDETEQNLTELLQQTLISLPQRMKEASDRNAVSGENAVDESSETPAE